MAQERRPQADARRDARERKKAAAERQLAARDETSDLFLVIFSPEPRSSASLAGRAERVLIIISAAPAKQASKKAMHPEGRVGWTARTLVAPAVDH